MSAKPLVQEILDECTSTNDMVRGLGEQRFPHGCWISARHQTAGRGRHGREWVSLDGNLFLSLLIRMKRRELWSWLPLAAGVGVLRVLREDFPRLNVLLKWPNDVYIGPSKVGGVLCEGYTGSLNAEPFAVLGVGLNVGLFPEAEGIRATSLSHELRQELPVDYLCDQLRLEVAGSILQVVGQLEKEGYSFLKMEYERFPFFKKGDAVWWEDHGREQVGVVESIGEHGELLVQLPQQGLKSLYTESIALVN